MSDTALKIELHHIGCLTADINAVVEDYSATFGIVEQRGPIYVSSQRCYVCFLDLGNAMNLELIQPLDPDSALAKLMKKGVSYYHLAYQVEDIDSAIEKFLANKGMLVNTFDSEAFENKKCAFLYTGSFHLIELIQK